MTEKLKQKKKKDFLFSFFFSLEYQNEIRSRRPVRNIGRRRRRVESFFFFVVVVVVVVE